MGALAENADPETWHEKGSLSPPYILIQLSIYACLDKQPSPGDVSAVQTNIQAEQTDMQRSNLVEINLVLSGAGRSRADVIFEL